MAARFRQRAGRFEAVAISPSASSVALLGLVLLYALLTALASSRHLWHDELYTYYIATAPSLSKLWDDLHLDLNPPLEYLAVRLSTMLLGTGSYAVRLPSMIGFLVGSLCFGHFTARRLGAAYGFLAILVFWASPFFAYATEARPYALVLGFLGMALLAWQRRIERPEDWISVAVLALAVAGMMLSHLMSIFYIGPFCLAELVRTRQRHRVDTALWAALLIPCAIPFLFLHLMARFEGSSFPPAFQASLRKIPETYYGSLRLEALPLLLGLGVALALLTWLRADDRSFVTSPTPPEAGLIVGFLAVPAAVILALMRSHAAYFDRYAFPVSLAYALVVAFFLAQQTQRSRLAAVVASCVLVVFVTGLNGITGLKESVWSRRGVQAQSARSLDDIAPELPLVAASGLTFLEMDRYADQETVARLCYLTDREFALRYARATIFEGLPELKQHFPIRASVASYRSFVTQHPRFLVLGTPDYPEDWLLRELVDIRANVQYLGDFAIPYKDTHLYRVSMPDIGSN